MSESIIITESESESQQIPIPEPEPQPQIPQQQPEQQATKKTKKHGKLKKLLFEIIEKHNITNYNEIMERWNSFFVDQPVPKMPSKTTIFNAFQAYKRQNEVKTETEQQLSPESIVIVEDNAITEEEKKILNELNGIEKDKVVSAIITGKIEKKHIETVFRIENKILNATLGEEYKLDSETIDMLATVGEQPLNQMFGKYLTDSNSNIYIFIGLVAWAHVPVIIKILKDGKLWKKKKTLP